MKYPVLIAFLLLSASRVTGQQPSLNAYQHIFKKELKTWASSFKGFSLTSFRNTDTVEFESLPFGDMNDLKDFYKIYKPALSFSPDKSRFIDIYSYWLNLEKEGNKLVAYEEVDQAISFCDLKKRKWTRIYFLGSSARIEEVVWISNDRFLMAGTFMDEKDQHHPFVMDADILTHSFLVFEDRSAVMGSEGFTSWKLKQLHIQEE